MCGLGWGVLVDVRVGAAFPTHILQVVNAGGQLKVSSNYTKMNLQVSESNRRPRVPKKQAKRPLDYFFCSWILLRFFSIYIG